MSGALGFILCLYICLKGLGDVVREQRSVMCCVSPDSSLFAFIFNAFFPDVF
jgi:hypothetical protein